jgi:hypothetical protein
MKYFVVAGLALTVTLGCASHTLQQSRTPAAYPLLDEDALVLGTAIESLGAYVSGWSQRTYLVVLDSPSMPQFPLSKSRAADNRLLLARVERRESLAEGDRIWGSWDRPVQGEALDIDGGPTIPSALVSSILDRSDALNVLPRPQTSERLVVANADSVSNLFRPG